MRPKGLPNKSSTNERELFKDLILKDYKQLKYNIGELKPHDRIKIIELLKFVLPAFDAIDR